MTEMQLARGQAVNITPVSTQMKLDYLAQCGITTSVVYGPAGDKGIMFSVDVLTLGGQSFEQPFAASSYNHAVNIALLECVGRGWVGVPDVYPGEVTQ